MPSGDERQGTCSSPKNRGSQSTLDCATAIKNAATQKPNSDTSVREFVKFYHVSTGTVGSVAKRLRSAFSFNAARKDLSLLRLFCFRGCCRARPVISMSSLEITSYTLCKQDKTNRDKINAESDRMESPSLEISTIGRDLMTRHAAGRAFPS